MVQPLFHSVLTKAKRPEAPIIVIGMHRSGTTLLSKMLTELIVYMGDDLESNWESTCFLDINDQMLRLNGASWKRPDPFLGQISDSDFIERNALIAQKALETKISEYGEVPSGWRWGWKDPRTTLTLPIWLRLFPQAKVIHIVRNGIDVALSLQRRSWRRFLRPRHNNIERLFPISATLTGYRLWQTYVGQAREYSLIFSDHIFQIKYEDLLKNPYQELVKLLSFIDAPDLSEKVCQVADSLIRIPTRRSFFDKVYMRFLFLSSLLDRSYLEKFGYCADDLE